MQLLQLLLQLSLSAVVDELSEWPAKSGVVGLKQF